jgi:hypothetical protein
MSNPTPNSGPSRRCQPHLSPPPHDMQQTWNYPLPFFDITKPRHHPTNPSCLLLRRLTARRPPASGFVHALIYKQERHACQRPTLETLYLTATSRSTSPITCHEIQPDRVGLPISQARLCDSYYTESTIAQLTSAPQHPPHCILFEYRLRIYALRIPQHHEGTRTFEVEGMPCIDAHSSFRFPRSTS